jgi:hypothetical protein
MAYSDLPVAKKPPSSDVPLDGKPGALVPRKTGNQTGGEPASKGPPRTKAGAPALGDVAFIVGKDEHGTHIVRRRSEEAPLEAGLLRPLREGKPIEGEVVSLTPRKDVPLLFDVKSELPDPHERVPHDGPAQVASDAYRRGWEAIYGHRRRDHSVN